MEAWERLIESWSGEEDVAAFSKLAHSAEGLLKEDLADFEIEWVWTSLLSSPVHLPRTVESRAMDPAWSKPLGDALRLLTHLAERWPDSADTHHDVLVKICSARLDARTRAVQLKLLATLATRSLDGLRPRVVLADLEAATTCRAPLVQLLGTICEWHPEVLADETPRVWRAVLRLLEHNTTDTVRAAALRAASQVLTHYGEDLPVREVALLYPLLSSGSKEALELLSNHAALFREQLLQDSALRRRLWGAAEGQVEPELAGKAAVAVTDAALRAAEPDRWQSLVSGEVAPLVHSPCARVRFAAARMSRAHGVLAAPAVDALALEQHLQAEYVPEHVAEAVWWCIECSVPRAAALLSAAVEAHARLTVAQRARLRAVLRAHAASTAPGDAVALEFLLSESSRADDEQYMQLWREVCAGVEGSAAACWLAARVAALIRAHSQDFPEMPLRVQAVLRVCARALPGADERAHRILTTALSELRTLPPAALLLLRLLPRSDAVDTLLKGVEVEHAVDEEALCACALAAVHAPHAVSAPQVLAAVQEVCLRRDAESETLSAALRALTTALDEGATKHHSRAATQALRAVRRLAGARDAGGGGRADRQLRRDLMLFIGKYGRSEDDIMSVSELVSAALRDQLTLVLPAEHTDCNVSLRPVLQLALDRGHVRALRLLTALLADYLRRCAGPREGALRALAHVVCARAAQAARGEGPPPRAPHLPALAPYLLDRVWVARGGARGVLCAALRPLLHGAELQHAVHRVLDVLAHGTLPERLSALTLTPALVSALTGEPALASTLLPRLPPLLVRGAERSALPALQAALDALKHTPELFSKAALDKMVEGMVQEALYTQVTSHNAPAYCATLDLVVQHLAHEWKSTAIIETVLGLCDRDNTIFHCYYLLAKVKEQFKSEEFKMIHREAWLVESMKRKRDGEFDAEAVLLFVAAFSDTLLEHYNEETIDAVCDVVCGLTASSVPRLQAALAACARCLPAPPPRKVARALEAWADTLPLQEVTEHLSRSQPAPPHARVVRALRAVLEAVRAPHAACMLPRLTAAATRWPHLVFQMFTTDYDKDLLEHIQYLGDAAWVGVYLGRAGALPRLLRSDTQLRAARALMPHIYTFFLYKPYILCEPELATCCTLLRDIAACCPQHQAADLLELADELWEQYCNHSTASEQAGLLRALVAAGAGAESRCVQSAARRVADVATPLSDRALLLPALPPLPEHTVYTSFCAALPARVAECSGERALALRALLDAAATAHSPALLDALAALVSGRGGPAWLVPALDTCMRALAARAPPACLHLMYARVKDLPLPATDYMLVPLLRASPTSACEGFYSLVMSGELSALRAAPAPADSRAFRRALHAHSRAATLLALLPDKVSRDSLESPTSPLHAQAGGVRTWHFVREACKLLVAVQRKVTAPEDAPTDLADAVRVFRERAYCALCALVCAWRADERLYAHVTGAAWRALARDLPYHLPLRARESHRKLSGTSEAADKEADAAPRTSCPRTPRTARVFLRTLTENPYLFDLFEDDDIEEEETRGELQVADSEINRHPCAGALSALLSHLATHAPIRTEPPARAEPAATAESADVTESAVLPAWLTELCAALKEAPVSVRYLLAQCTINVRTQLQPLAYHLAPALLAVVVDTAHDTVNSLHVQILETAASWHASAPFPVPETTLCSCSHALVRTCAREHAARALHSALLARLATFLHHFPCEGLPETDVLRGLNSQDGGEVVAWLRVVARACSAGVHAPDVLSALLARLHAAGTTTPHVAELCKAAGAAVRAAPPGERAAAGARLAATARARLADPAAYVAMLYHAQCTDLQHFKSVADIACKVRAVRSRCVSVLAGCARAHVPPRALRDLRDQLPPDLRGDVLDKCPELVVEEFFTESAPLSPRAKRARVDSVDSRVLDTRADVRALTRALARLTPSEREQRLADKLADDLPTRLVECTYTCVYLPASLGEAPAGGGVPALARLLLQPLRAQHRFQRATIPSPPSSSVAGVVPTFRTASLRTLGARSAPAHATARVADTSADDQPIPMEEAVDILLDFGELQSCWEVSAGVVADVWRALRPRTGPLPAALAGVLADTLSVARHPAALRLALLLAPLLDDVAPLQAAARAACDRWARSEAAGEARALHDELRARNQHPALRTLGLESVLDVDDDDDVSLEEQRAFSLEALVQASGSLAEWRRVPSRERRRKLRSLPPLWTTGHIFSSQLDLYQPGEESWLSSCLRVTREGDATRELRAASRWPVRADYLAAVCEAIEAGEGRTVTSVPALHDASCLAEWAARLQLRAHAAPGARARHHAHARAWCRAALARDMPLHALHCVNVHVSGEAEVAGSEVCAWATLATRAWLGLARGADTAPPDCALLRRASKMAARALQHAASHEAVPAAALLAHAHFLDNTLTDDILATCLSTAKQANKRDSNSHDMQCEREGDKTTHYTQDGVDGKESDSCSVDSESERDSMRQLCDTAVLYYDDTWDTREIEANILLVSEALQLCASETGVAVLINRLLEGRGQTLTENAADCLIRTLHPLMSSLPPHYVSRLAALGPSLPADHVVAFDRLTDSHRHDKCRACLRLVCGAERVLLYHLDALQRAVDQRDADAWSSAFVSMESEVFESPLGGPEYRALLHHRATLAPLRETGANISGDNRAACRATLRAVASALSNVRRGRSTRSVAALCPALHEAEALSALQHVLRLPAPVLRVDDEIQVFTDSVSAPGVLSVQLAGGARRRFLVKRERGSRAGAGAALAAALRTRTPDPHPYPQVVSLGEGCEMVEFLEGHERLRDLLQEELDLDSLCAEGGAHDTAAAAALSEQAALTAWTRVVRRVPAAALRRAWERRCAGTAHYLRSQARYCSWVAHCTVLCWLGALGDRHLLNVLVEPARGALLAVDWGALGLRDHLPARLTHQLTHMLPEGWLEASLECAVCELRRTRRAVIPRVALALRDPTTDTWRSQVSDVEALLSGAELTRDVTARALRSDALAQLVRTLPAPPELCAPKERYSLQHQVGELLVQSTSPRALSVARTAWESWL